MTAPQIGWIRLVLAVACLVALCSCTAMNHTRTVGKGKWGIEGTLGGPILTDLGPPIPAPNIFLGARRGMLDDMDVSLQYNLTAPIIPGIPLHLITGVDWVPVQPGIRFQQDSPEKGWGAGTGLDIQWLTDFQHGLIILPSLDLTGSYRLSWFSPFIGIGLGMNFYRPDSPEATPTPLQICPYAGAEFIIRNRLAIGLKCSINDIAYNYFGSQVSWVYLVDKPEDRRCYGLFGLSLGFSYALGRR